MNRPIHHKPIIKKFRVRDLRIDPDSQREFNNARGAKLARDFRWEALGIILVSERPNGVFVIDGQHRLAALIANGYADVEIVCEVHQSAGQPIDAERFLDRNDVLAVRTFDKFRIRAVAGQEDAVHIIKIVEAAGCQISRAVGNGSISSVRALERVYGLGADVLEDTLATLIEAFGRTGRHVFEGGLILGVGFVLGRYREIPWGEFARKIAGYPGNAAGILGDARVSKRGTGGTIPDAVAHIIIEAYNKGRKTRLDDWKRGRA